MAHAPLLRNNTTPIFKRDRDPGSGPPPTMSAPRASQLSGTTAFNSPNPSLVSVSSAQTLAAGQNGGNSGPVQATANIINQKADASRSLYQICIALRQRLSQVPGFEVYFGQLDQPDPVEAVWSLLKEGTPLLAIFNEALQPAEHLKIDDAHVNAAPPKKSKIAAFKFVQACLKDLSIPSSECFVINDLMGTDTTGLVKVCFVLSLRLVARGAGGSLLPCPLAPAKTPNSDANTLARSHKSSTTSSTSPSSAVCCWSPAPSSMAPSRASPGCR
ncbi:MAG: hypothetical protein IMZ46_04930 [Acidobacteria bacterium]|nr:hypothetical protein [Acidobacteriota bacterium]